jgi:hypothetical protein
MFESSTYQKKDTSYLEERYMLLWLIFSGMAILFLILELSSLYFIISLITSTVFYFKWRYFNTGKEKLDGKFQAQLKLSKTSIYIDNEEFPVEKLENIGVHIRHIFGDKVTSAWNIYTIKNGTDNAIEFTYKNKNHQYNFWIKSENHKEELRNVLKDWYLAKIKFKETFNKNKSFLLEDLNYDQIQAFKSQYQLN